MAVPNDDDQPIASWGDWQTNGHLIADIARLGWLNPNDRILDATYGLGTFWTEWKPDPIAPAVGRLMGVDINPSKSCNGVGVDFTNLPYPRPMFDVVVFDPPYKLNGTPDETVDERYGVEVATKWQDRMELIERGVVECARVSKDRLLVKVMDQVCSGKVRWQTTMVINRVEGLPARDDGRVWRLADRFDMIGSARKQPGGRTQRHSYGRGSTMLVFVLDRPQRY